jgi:flagellin-like protein
MLSKMLKRLYHKRKAVSPVIAAILLIALTVTAVAIVVFIVMPMLRGQPELVIMSYDFEDSNANDFADSVTMKISNLGTEGATISEPDFKRDGETINWEIEGGDPVTISPASEETITFIATTENDEVGYGCGMELRVPFGKSSVSVDTRITAEFSHFVLLYEEDFESGEPSGWVHHLLFTHGGGSHNLADWEVNSQGGSERWQCTNNDCQFIVLEDDDRDFYDVNMSYDLMTNDNDANGIVFRYDDTGAYPKFYVIWYTNEHPAPDSGNGPHSGEGQYFDWDSTSDRLKHGYITVHYIEGYDAGGGEIGYKYYKIAENNAWTRSNNIWYTWRIVADGSNMELYIDSATSPIFSFSDNRISHGYVGLISHANQNAYYDNLYAWHTES